jgi:hypothetical protein
MAIGSHVCGSRHITKPKKNEKIILCLPIKSYLFSYGNGFFSKLRVCYAFIAHEVQKKYVLSGFSTKT